MTFNCLWLVFTKASIFGYFDLECHIRIEIDVFGYAIEKVLSQLILRTSPNKIVIKADLDQWHPIIFFSRKIILVETQYKTYDSELLAIVKIFKI